MLTHIYLWMREPSDIWSLWISPAGPSKWLPHALRRRNKKIKKLSVRCLNIWQNLRLCTLRCLHYAAAWQANVLPWLCGRCDDGRMAYISIGGAKVWHHHRLWVLALMNNTRMVRIVIVRGFIADIVRYVVAIVIVVHRASVNGNKMQNIWE